MSYLHQITMIRISPLLLILRIAFIATAANALAPAAPLPSTKFQSAADIPDPPLAVLFEPSVLDDALLSVFRWTLQRQTGLVSPDPGFDGLVEELRLYMQTHTIEEQATASYQTMVALSGPIPFLFKHLFASSDFIDPTLAWFSKWLLPFLVGKMTLTAQLPGNDEKGGGVLVDRCRVLEASSCKGVCARMCKEPTERFFANEWGVPLSMSPNFETGQCQLAFGVQPLPIHKDPTIPPGCLTRCPSTVAITANKPANYSC